jgi:hypothetical protein
MLPTMFRPLKPFCQMNRNLVGSIFGRSSVKTAYFVPIRWQTWSPQTILVSDWPISNNLLLWNSFAKWSELWWIDTIFKFLYSIMFTLTLQISKLPKAVVLNSFPRGRFWQFVYKEIARCTRLMQRSLQVVIPCILSIFFLPRFTPQKIFFY